MYNCLPSDQGFLGLDAEQSASVSIPRALVIPFGLEQSVSFGRGTARGPLAILEASHQVELFDEDFWCEPWKHYGVCTLAPVIVPEDTTAALNLLADLINTTLTAGKFPLTLGGEHTITAGIMRAFSQRFEQINILHFDAHADLRDSYSGNRYSHASAIRRCLDLDNVNVVSIGIRNISSEEIHFFESNKHRVHIHWAKDKSSWTPRKVLAPLVGNPVYLSFDVDAFDASLMPATGTPEPGGLFWDDVITLVREISDLCTIVGADITELSPRPQLHGCDFTTAKLAYKILNYSLLGSRQKITDSTLK